MLYALVPVYLLAKSRPNNRSRSGPKFQLHTMDSSEHVLALAIINNSNTPVLVRTRDQDSLGLLFKLHASLDVVDEKQATREPFLGILSQSDSYKIYGLCSVTQTKILLMANNTLIRDNEARSILRSIHNTYVEVVTNNPFYTYGTAVKANEKQYSNRKRKPDAISRRRRRLLHPNAQPLVPRLETPLLTPIVYKSFTVWLSASPRLQQLSCFLSLFHHQVNTTDNQRGQGVIASRCSGGKGDPSRPHSTSYGHNSGSLSPSSRRWNPPSNIRRDAHVNPQYDKNIDYKVRGILNKITPDKFDKLSRELLDLGLESHDVLKRVLLLIFNKALDDSKYSCMYAKLCRVIYDSLSRHYEEESNGGKRDIFKILLLSKCKEEFENRRNAFEKFEATTQPLSTDDEELRSIAKQKMLGNIKFICELGKQQLLPQNILHDCIKQLLSKKKTQSLQDKTQDLECLSEIMKNIGYLLEEKEEARGLLDQYFERMDTFCKNPELLSRIRFMLLDVIDLRKNNWIPRQKEALPSTISDPKNDYRDNEVLLSQYGFPFIRQNMNHMKSARCDDVFSQINLGPYYLGTGPGAINDVSHLPNMNNYNQGGRRNNNYQNNNYNNQGFGAKQNQFPNYPNSNQRDGQSGRRDGRGRDRDDRGNDGYSRQNNHQQQQQQPPQSNAVSGNMLSNGLNQLNANRDMINLPPRFQKQMKQNTAPAFQPFVKNEPDNRQPGGKPSGMGGGGGGGMYKGGIGIGGIEGNSKPSGGGGLLGLMPGPNFQKPNSFIGSSNNGNGKYPIGGSPMIRQNMNGKELNVNFVNNDLSQLKVSVAAEDSASSDSEQSKPVNAIVEVEKLLSEYFKSDNNSQDFITGLKPINISFDETLLIIIRIAIGRAEAERDLAYKLIIKLKAEESMVTELAFLAALKNLFCKIVELEVETPRARSLVAGFVANLITEDALTLKEVGDLLDGGLHYPLFPLLLQNLHKAKGQSWLFDAFTDSKINLINMLPENDRNKERMADILEDRNLTFLYPMLRIESDIAKQITSSECTPQTLYRWLKDNVNPTLQASTEFISVVFTALLKHIISKHNSDETPNVFSNTLFTAQENELGKYQQVLQVFLTGKQDLQLVVLYSLQTYCHEINFPKGLIEKWFNMLYEFEIVDEEVYAKWKEDINDEYPGKGRALFQVNKWLTWLEETEEDEDE